MIEIPGYVIKREIGVGGMASVHLAVQSSLEREVALKVMAPALAADPVFSKRFLEEARMLASLAHPNIVAVYDVDVTPGKLHYFSMQYLPGGDFSSRVRRGHDERELTLTLAGVASALGYAHKRGYVHCDVSPGNILFDANSIPVLTDFGIALAETSGTRVTSSGFAIGTSHYMSPEQARGGDMDARSDIYSLGVLAYFGLTGKPPFDGPDGFAVAYAHVFEPIPRLPGEYAHWQGLIDRALAKKPSERYADTEEFLDAMAAAVPAYAPLFHEASIAGVPAAATMAATNAEPATRRLPAAVPPPAKPGSDADEAPTRISRRAEAATLTTLTPTPTNSVQRKSILLVWARRVWPLAFLILGAVLIGSALWFRGSQAPATDAPGGKTGPLSPAPVASAPAAPTSPATAGTQIGAGTGELQDNGVPAENSTVASGAYPSVVDPLAEALRLGRQNLVAQRLTLPAGSNAYDQFRLALRLDPRNKEAKRGIEAIAAKYLEFAQKNLASGDTAQFNDYLNRAGDVLTPTTEYAESLRKIAEVRGQAAAPLIASAKKAAAAWDKTVARTDYQKALQLDPGNRDAQQGLKYVETIGQAGFTFRDSMSNGTTGPTMVVLPGARLAMARDDVTRAEFRTYWNAAGRARFGKLAISCRDRESIFRSSRDRDWQHPGIPQNDSHPVVCVTWREAVAYTQWLSQQTGKAYRLPSPAEFDRVVRKASKVSCASNLADATYNRQYNSDDGSKCSDGHAATAPDGSFPLVEGIADIDGNVREWSAACGDGKPVGAGGSCRSYLVKGRGWLSRAAKEPLTFSDTYGDDIGLNTIGFRVVRDLDP